MEYDKDLPTDMLHDCDDLLHAADSQPCILVVHDLEVHILLSGSQKTAV